tara:strand:+ start:3861 stop:5540 length:1680 start_codon:yes stop_codon:yes gene_type:complete
MLNREERKLLHHKSKQPTLGRGKPNNSEGFEGDIAYRKIEGSGTVQFIKQSGVWVAMASSGQIPPQRTPVKRGSSSSGTINVHKNLLGLGDDNHTQYLLVDGTRAMTGNLNMGSQNIGSVIDLDVNGHTTLDQVTIDTTDGAFAVSGANNIQLTTTSTNDIVLTSARDYDLNISGECDWHTSITDWDNSGAFDLTSVGDITIETSGANTDKTILIKNTNNDTSAFRGIHLKVDSQGTASSQNSILIECDNRASKGGGIGVDIRSEDGVLIRGEDANNSDKSNVQIRATSSIDLGGGTNSITATIGVPNRVKIHGIFETSNLYRPATDKVITTDIGTNTDGSATGEHVRFEAIDTYNLIRSMTTRVNSSIVFVTDSTCDTSTTTNPETVTITNTGNPNAAVISDGMKVTGSGIPSNTFVANKSTSSFTLRNSSGSSVDATANGTNVTLSFFNNYTLLNNDFIGIVSPISNGDDDSIGTVYKITITWQISSTNYAQVWYCAKQNSKFAWMSSNNGESLAANDKGIVTWTTSNGIRWQNATGSTVTFVRCSALKIQSGGSDF